MMRIKEKIHFLSYLSFLLRFQKASVSPAPASENQRLYAAASPSAHQRCNGKSTSRYKPTALGGGGGDLLINLFLESNLERHHSLYYK